MFFAPSKSRKRAKIWIMGISKSSDHIKIKIKNSNHSQEPPASSKAQNEDANDMDVFCTFKIKIESQNSYHGYTKISDHIQIKIKMPNPSQEPLASSKVPNEDLKDMDVLYTFKIKIESQNLILEDIDVLCTLKSI